jgi:hypothetical protein
MENVKHHLKIINQFFEIEKKLAALNGAESAQRNVMRIKGYFEEMGYQIHNPIGESYSETRTDCEASIAGASAENLYINEVIKPIVRYFQEGQPQIIQKGVVITKSR